MQLQSAQSNTSPADRTAQSMCNKDSEIYSIYLYIDIAIDKGIYRYAQ